MGMVYKGKCHRNPSGLRNTVNWILMEYGDSFYKNDIDIEKLNEIVNNISAKSFNKSKYIAFKRATTLIAYKHRYMKDVKDFKISDLVKKYYDILDVADDISRTFAASRPFNMI